MYLAISSFFSGLVFAIGLGLSGFLKPSQIQSSLHWWQNTNLKIICGLSVAIIIHALTYVLIQKRTTPFLDIIWHVPTKKEFTPQLILGSIIFGIGWGLVGFSPGSAIVSLASGQSEVFIFVMAMIMGMRVYLFLDQLKKASGVNHSP